MRADRGLDLVSSVLRDGAGPVLGADLRRAGLTAADVRSLRREGDLRHLFRGSYEWQHGESRAQDRYRTHVLAFADARRFRAAPPVLTGPAAAVLHDLPLVGRPPTTIHVLRSSASGPSTRGLTTPTGRASAEERTVVAGIATVRAGRAALDTARLMGVVAGVAAADAALHRALVDRCTLEHTLVGMGRLPGIARSRRCVTLADARSESPGESWSAVVLDDLGLPVPERQQLFRDLLGTIGRVDFWWPDHGVVGEFDGRVKYGRANPSGRPPEDVLWEEKLREDRLRAIGLTVVRWTTADLRGPEQLAHRLRAVLGPR